MVAVQCPGAFAGEPEVHPGPTEPLQIQTKAGAISLSVEVAQTPHERNQGLMYRHELAPLSGMLFVFERRQRLTFWMKNTYISLDMIFIDSDGKIVAIVTHTTPLSTDFISPFVRASAVLEVNAGFTEAHDVEVGDHIVHPAFNAIGAAP